MDIYIAKYSSSGKLLFAKSIGNASTEAAFGVAIDGSGNIHVVGQFNGNAVDFDPGPGVALLSSTNAPGGTANDVFFAKYDTDGNYILAKVLNGSGIQAGNHIEVDASGNIIIGGTTRETVDFDPGPAEANITVPSGQDLYLAKYYAGAGSYICRP